MIKKIILTVCIITYSNITFSADPWNKNLDVYTPQEVSKMKPFMSDGYPFGIYQSLTPPISADKVQKLAINHMIPVKGGEFTLLSGKKITLKSFYMDRYLTSYLLFHSYMNAIHQYHPISEDENHPSMNGDFPAGVDYHNAKGYCAWLSKKTGLPFALPTLAQWLYAATSRGTNWDYPTNNGKLEIGKNYPDVFSKKFSDEVSIEVTGNPVNSLGIHQFFGNGSQWTQTVVDSEITSDYYINAVTPGNIIVAGTDFKQGFNNKDIEHLTLDFDSYISPSPNAKMDLGGLAFRCVINTDNPLPSV